MSDQHPPAAQRVRRARRRARHWKHRLVIITYRALRWGQRYLPPGVRSLIGLALIAGGLLGFLPILGFWMLPLGIAIASLDFPPMRRRLERWLIDTRRRYHIENTQAR